MSRYDYVIVGSGLYGSTFAYRAKKAGKRCLVIERRPHMGGNVYCSPTPIPSPEGEVEHIINVHKYGAHIFHTNNKEVWDFVNSFVEFNRYTNCPVANYKGELYNLPFNMNTFNKMWPDVHTPSQAQARIEEQRSSQSPQEGGGMPPRNLEEQAISLVGTDIYRKLIKEYTEKQWGKECKDLPAFIIKRLPLRFTYDNNYFNDKYQGIPVGGYNKLIEGLLCPPRSPQEEGRIDTLVGIEVPLNGPKQKLNISDDRGAYREKGDVLNYGLLNENAKQMRKKPTEAENVFWDIVRGRSNPFDAKFRRQHVIGEYIVDFICLEKNLIIELDGGYHSTDEQQTEDRKRTKYLNECGYTVFHIKNEQLLTSPESVIEKIRLAMIISENLPKLGGLRGAFKDNSSPLLGGVRGAKLVYTGPLDEYFDYSLGRLDWRTVYFKTRVVDTPNYQGNAVVNYTSHDVPFTRVIEHKHFEMFGQNVYDCPKSVVSEEYSTEYKEGMEPYYPINDERNNAIAEKYRKLAEKENNVIFGGRLAQYRYYDMAPVIEQVLNMLIV